MFVLGTLTSLLAIASAGPTLNASDSVGAENSTYRRPGDQPRLIPVKEVGCWGEYLNVVEVQEAKKRLEEWGVMHHIHAASYNGQVAGHTAVWICNCKHFRRDYVVKAELDEAETLVSYKCGKNITGWVWSSKWQKSYNFGPSVTFYEHKHRGFLGHPGQRAVKCPKSCILHGNREPNNNSIDGKGYDPNDDSADGYNDDPNDDSGDAQGGDQGDDQDDEQNDDKDSE
ncbi:hypothetical protein F4801DRAFT_333595 [Xylaria longipes]|nr:hypothetical protein F4801DRAFT_333595 [Xylaria longipes]RYC59746.1 hypothetical protein CHU98_g6485 [Xylaria longipes]